MTRSGWRMLEQLLPKLTTCFVLDLRNCGISSVSPLVDMLPKLTRMCKCFDLGGNNLSATSVALLKEAMTKHFAYIRPTWLALGDNVCATAYLHDPLQCNPHYGKGCLHTQRSVVHVVSNLLTCRQKHPSRKKNVDGKVESKECPKQVSEQGTSTPLNDLSIDNQDSVTPVSMDLNVGVGLRNYVEAQHSVVNIETLQSWAPFGAIIAAPLVAAARIARSQANSALGILQGALGKSLTTIIVNQGMYILANTLERRLTFINVTNSVQTGRLIDFNGCDANDATPLQDFAYMVEADAHEAGHCELNTMGGERLRINFQADYLLNGWVITGSSRFPIRKCKII